MVVGAYAVAAGVTCPAVVVHVAHGYALLFGRDVAGLSL